MMQMDRKAALLSVDRSAEAAVLVRAPDVLAMISEWFDLLWDDRLTTIIGSTDQPGLKPDQMQVLRLLGSADTDESIAKSMGTSVTTVRRHIRAIYEVLGVNTRFAAGAAAVRRGWI
jgi:DNA-binding NarL/FixJ family response regulator